MTKFEHVWTIAIANIVRPDQLYGGDVVTLQQLAQSLSYLSAKQALHIRHPSKVLQNLLRKEALSWKKRMTQVQSTPVFLEGICGSHSPRILSASRPFVRSDLTQILADSARNPQHITYFDILWYTLIRQQPVFSGNQRSEQALDWSTAGKLQMGYKSDPQNSPHSPQWRSNPVTQKINADLVVRWC